MGWYQRVFAGTGRAPAVLMLIGFLVTFAVTRAITRRIRARASAARTQPPDPGRGGLSDLYIGGVHVHHQVWGILLVLASGLLQFRDKRPHRQPADPSRQVSACRAPYLPCRSVLPAS